MLYVCIFLRLIFVAAVTIASPSDTANDVTTQSNDRLHHQRRANENVGNNKGGGSSICTTAILERGIPPKDVKRSATAARISQLVRQLGDGGNNLATTEAYGFANGSFYESGIDAVYTVRVDNEYCVAAFRGTMPFMMEDWRSNVIVDPVEFSAAQPAAVVGGGGVCEAHRGYHDAYYAFEHRSSVEDFLDTCIADCPSCDLVLTGHSQGGGIAEVANLYLRDRYRNTTNNYVITFGGTQSLGAGCLDIFTEEERCRWYRYIMAAKAPLGNGLVYDPIPMLIPRLLEDEETKMRVADESYARYGGIAFVGHELFVSSDDPSAVCYTGFDDHHQVDLARLDVTGIAHLDTLYADVLEQQSELYPYDFFDGKSDGGCPLPATGFSPGSLCNPGENTCGTGTECEEGGFLGWMFGSNNICRSTAAARLGSSDDIPATNENCGT